jgi:predicted MFS family arabinose efflux permease
MANWTSRALIVDGVRFPLSFVQRNSRSHDLIKEIAVVSNQMETYLPAARRRFVLPAGSAMAGAVLNFTSLYLAAGVLTPLLVVYREQWQFPGALLTLAFAVYAFGFLAALLTLGSLSDHVGRRPVLIGALLIQLASIVMFLFAPDIGWVIAARVVQGVATGSASGALTAALVELAPPRWKRFGTILGSVSVTGGLAVGSLLAGIAIQVTTAANSIAFSALGVITILGIVAIALSPETVSRAPGALRSLVPRVAVPAAARTEFAAAASVLAAVWMLAGLSGGLGATGIITGVFAGSLATMFIGQAVAGVAFGASFTAALSLIFPLAAAHQRAGLVAGIYIVSYTGFGVPVVIAGQLTDILGEVPTVTWYTALTILLALISLIGQIRIKHGARRSEEPAHSLNRCTRGAAGSKQAEDRPGSAAPAT